MQRRQLLSLLALSSAVQASTPTGHYADIRGQRLYYETHGNGRPLLVLHGAVAASEVFGLNLPVLAGSCRVIAPHLQGHGFTPDIARPLRFEDLADDVAALARHLGLEQVDVLGYALGGGVALQLAIRHPALVRRLVVASQPCRRSAWLPQTLADFDAITAQASKLARSPLAERYPQIDWAVQLRKLRELLARDYDWSTNVAALKARTLLVFADGDALQPEHMVEFHRLLGSASQWAVLPGTTQHNLLATDAVARLALPFLDAA